MLKLAICDNDIVEVKTIRELLAVCKDIEVFTYLEPLKLNSEITAGTRYDIYLLDIVMPEMNGLNLAEHIRAIDENAVIIFLTNHDEHAISAFGVRAFQYLLKPVDANLLRSELEQAKKLIVKRENVLFPIKTRDGLVNVPFHKIIYCCIENRCVICVDSDNRIIRSSTLRTPFAAVVQPLLENQSFVQTHISFVANLNHVTCLKEHDFSMNNGSLVPISQKYCKEVKERYLSHVFGDE